MKFAERHPETLKRFERFWKGEEADRPVLYISFPREEPDPGVEPPDYARPADRLDPEAMLAQARYKLSRAGYFAEGFPHFFVNYGPGVLHACIGGDLHVRDERTIWFPEFLDDLADFEKLRFDPGGKWWRKITETTRLLLAEVGDELVVSYTDIGGNADILASLIGSQKLLMECADRPEVVKAAMGHVHGLWMQSFNHVHDTLAAGQDVFTPWYSVLSAGRMYMTQCDFNAMIGPDMFRELFAPELGATYRELDNPAFHLDGLNTQVHVPALIEQGVQCIQWTPPPGHKAVESIDMFRQIHEAGVSITCGADPEHVETFCRELDHRRICLLVRCKGADEAEKLVEKALRSCEKK